MNPAPPVTRTRIRGGYRRLLTDRCQAGAQAVAPVRQDRSVLFAAEDRERRARGLRAELRRRHTPDEAVEARLLEDRLREVGPRAVAGGGDVPDAERRTALDQRPGGVGEVPDVRRAASLVGDDRDLVSLRAEP